MKVLFLSFSTALLLTGCSTTTYMNYAGAPVQQGKGGAFLVVDGMELWQEGRPNRPYRVVGVITDSRPVGIWTMGSRATTVARMAGEHGGDAVVMESDVREFAGTYTSGSSNWSASSYNNKRSNCGNKSGYVYGTSYGTSTTTPLYQAHSRFLVLRYH